MLKPYTVLLKYPDYMSDQGSETYLAFVRAVSPLMAQKAAARLAHRENEYRADSWGDFLPLLTIAGHHEDLNHA